MPPWSIIKSRGLSVCFVFLIFITATFRLSMVGSRERVITPSAKNSEIPSRERRDEPTGSSDVIIEVVFADSNVDNI